MSEFAIASAPRTATIPVRELAPWAVLGGAVLMALLYVVGLEQGALAAVQGDVLHEVLHDGRHLLGFPCH
ncbi:MAG: CbtB-domain containing protein [Pseudonocardiales bacterium]|nr:CbtB-domain containing protein [Pseudonocardiales bacterium]